MSGHAGVTLSGGERRRDRPFVTRERSAPGGVAPRRRAAPARLAGKRGELSPVRGQPVRQGVGRNGPAPIAAGPPMGLMGLLQQDGRVAPERGQGSTSALPTCPSCKRETANPVFHGAVCQHRRTDDVPVLGRVQPVRVLAIEEDLNGVRQAH